MEVPDTLAGKMALWRETGRIEKYADGLFYDASWIAVYLGQGVVPARHDPRAALPPPEQVARALGSLQDAIGREVAAMPGHREYLVSRAERLAAAPEHAGVSAARELPRRIVVVGAGQVGALAAIALRRALPQSEVLVVGTPPDPAALADRAPTALPFTNRLHDRLGIGEERLVREAGASHRLVVRYAAGAAKATKALPLTALPSIRGSRPASRATGVAARATRRPPRRRARSAKCSPPRGRFPATLGRTRFAAGRARLRAALEPGGLSRPARR
jgi:hypothetical protein